MLHVRPLLQKPNLCGPTSLRMVLEYYGIRTTERKIMTLCGYDAKLRDNGSARRLVFAAKRYGLRAYVKDFSTIRELKRLVKQKRVPVIVNWYDAVEPPVGVPEGHYSIAVDFDRTSVTFVDSEIGRKRKVPLTHFTSLWFDFSPPHEHSKKALVLRRMIVVYKK